MVSEQSNFNFVLTNYFRFPDIGVRTFFVRVTYRLMKIRLISFTEPGNKLRSELQVLSPTPLLEIIRVQCSKTKIVRLLVKNDLNGNIFIGFVIRTTMCTQLACTHVTHVVRLESKCSVLITPLIRFSDYVHSRRTFNKAYFPLFSFRSLRLSNDDSVRVVLPNGVLGKFPKNTSPLPTPVLPVRAKSSISTTCSSVG